MASEEPHSRKPYIDYYDDDMISLCFQSGIIAKRNKDRVHGMNSGIRPLCDHGSQQKYIISKARHWRIFSWRLGPLRYTLKHNNPRDTSHILIQPKFAKLLTLLAGPLGESGIEETIAYCHALDTLATYDSQAPETRLSNLKQFQKLFVKARKVTGEGGDVTILIEELKELETKLWVEVGEISRYAVGELDSDSDEDEE